jgi:hypothetical protein
VLLGPFRFKTTTERFMRAEKNKNQQNIIISAVSVYLLGSLVVHKYLLIIVLLQMSEVKSQNFRLKRVNYEGYDLLIACQHTSGPCSVLAIFNISILRREIYIPDHIETRSPATINMKEIIELINDRMRQNSDKSPQYESLCQSALLSLMKMQGNATANIVFNNVLSCEHEDEFVSVLKLLPFLKVHHMFAYDNSNPESKYSIVLRDYSFSALMKFLSDTSFVNADDYVPPEKDENRIFYRNSQGHMFIEKYSHQITEFGLRSLPLAAQSNELFILYAFNHFYVAMVQNNQFLLTLETADACVTYSDVVWRVIENTQM